MFVRVPVECLRQNANSCSADPRIRVPDAALQHFQSLYWPVDDYSG